MKLINDYSCFRRDDKGRSAMKDIEHDLKAGWDFIDQISNGTVEI